MGAVRNAMQRDDLDPTILDHDPEKSLESQRPVEKDRNIAATAQTDTNKHSDAETVSKAIGNDKTTRVPIDNASTTDSIHDALGSSPSVWSNRLGYPEEWPLTSLPPDFLPKVLTPNPVDEPNEAMDFTNADAVEENGTPLLNNHPVHEKFYRMMKMVRSMLHRLLTLFLPCLLTTLLWFGPRDCRWVLLRMRC